MGSLGMVVPVLNTVLSLMGPGSVMTRRWGRGFSLMPVIGKYTYYKIKSNGGKRFISLYSIRISWIAMSDVIIT